MSITILATFLDRWGHHGWNDGGGWWLWGLLMMGAWIALIVWVVTLVARRTDDRRPEPTDRARAILAERYASGEITTDEYHERLRALDNPPKA